MKRYSWWSHTWFSGVTRAPNGHVPGAHRLEKVEQLARDLGTMFNMSLPGLLYVLLPPHESNELSSSFKVARTKNDLLLFFF